VRWEERESGIEGERERGRKGEREGGRKGGREGGREGGWESARLSEKPWEMGVRLASTHTLIICK